MNLILLHVYVSSFEFKYTWNMYNDRVFMKFSQLLNISRHYYTLQSINIYSHFQGCLSMQFKAIQISKINIYFVENGLFYDTRLHAYSNKKKTCGKKRMQKMPPWHRYDHLTVLYFKQLPETLFKRYVLLT